MSTTQTERYLVSMLRVMEPHKNLLSTGKFVYFLVQPSNPWWCYSTPQTRGP